MDHPEIVLEVKNLVKRFEGLVAVDNLNFKVQKGRVHALIGPNGAGKTTTVNMITGDNPQTEGEVFFMGNPISKLPICTRANLGIGRTFQNIKLFSTMTVLENVIIGGQSKTTQSMLKYLLNFRIAKKEERHLEEKAEEILNFIGMLQYKDELVSNLAYGRQKMTELGRTLMGDPKLILLDEPAAGLNPSERKEFIEIVQKVFEQGVDMFLIEHNMDVVMNLSHDITVLNFGCKIAEGRPSEILENEQVISAYLGEGYRKQMKKGGSEGA
ncbi:ABC transporter ATP-binding protein [Anaerotruncus colihominis]|uniref:ABC transporter ATP-binding protein n=1 Tax=Anaerotruncus colihominis TaxID=169435 RepID=UPI00189B339E|nr:ABC transporter ATP-binding protein [Anaerotruncus colihominis]